MMYKWILAADGVLAMALVVAGLTGHSALAVTLAAVLVAGLLLAYLTVARTMRSVENGVYLLRAQDYGSRLRREGNPDADKVVDFFNSLMDRMKQERLKAAEQEHLLRLLVEASPQGIAICDYDGNIVEWNPAWERMADTKVLEACSRLKKGGSETVRTGETEVYSISRHAFMDNGFERAFFLAESVTEEVRKAERAMMTKVVRTMAHEVNNTLGSVSTVLESVADTTVDPDMRAAAESCVRGCRNLVDFLKGYSDIVKLPAPELVSVDLKAEMEAMLPLLRGVAGEGIEVSMQATEKDARVLADMVLIERVMVNAVKNAAESIGGVDGMIVLSVDGNMLSVSDNGPGLRPGEEELVFRPFYSSKRYGRGLGLMLVADVLREHGARFSLRTADGWTRLRMVFPRLSVEA